MSGTQHDRSENEAAALRHADQVIEHERSTRVADGPLGRAETRPVPVRRFRSPISWSYILRRFIAALVAIWGAFTIVFLAVNLNGNPVMAFVDPEMATVAEIEYVTRQMGYDQPVWMRYFIFLGQLLTGDMPDSYRYNMSSLGMVLERVPTTLILTGAGLAVGVVMGLAAGYVAGTSRSSVVRQSILVTMNIFRATPEVVCGILLVFVFAVILRWVPTMGMRNWTGLILPALVLGLSIAPSLARTFRASIISNLDSDHLKTALAKGVPPVLARLRHVGMNALVPVVSLLGLQIGNLLGGVILVENMFGIPGLGQLGASALNNRDYPVVIVVVTISAVAFIVVNFLVDVLVAILDPRIGAT